MPEPAWKEPAWRLPAQSEIAVVVLPDEALKARFNEPWSRSRSAAAGAGAGAVAGAGCFSEIGDSGGGSGAGAVIGGVAVLFCLGVTAVGTVAGALIGASTADTANEIEVATHTMQAALLQSRPTDDFRRILIEALRDKNVTVVTEDPASAPISLLIEIKELDLIVDAARSTGAIVFQVDVDRRDQNATFPEPKLTYSSVMNPQDYVDLGRDEAAKLRSMIDDAYRTVALQMTRQIVPE